MGNDFISADGLLQYAPIEEVERTITEYCRQYGGFYSWTDENPRRIEATAFVFQRDPSMVMIRTSDYMAIENMLINRRNEI